MTLTYIKPEVIPNEDFVFRNIHVIQYKKWQPQGIRPNESDFSHRYINGEREDGLSVNWEKYCSIETAFILLGLQKRKDGVSYIDPKEFKLIKLNVGDIRELDILSDSDILVIHDPIEDNIGHSLICFDEYIEDQVRLKLCELVESYTNRIEYPTDFSIILKEIEKRKKQMKIE